MSTFNRNRVILHGLWLPLHWHRSPTEAPPSSVFREPRKTLELLRQPPSPQPRLCFKSFQPRSTFAHSPSLAWPRLNNNPFRIYRYHDSFEHNPPRPEEQQPYEKTCHAGKWKQITVLHKLETGESCPPLSFLE